MLATEHLQWLLMSASLLEAHCHSVCQHFALSFYHTALPHRKCFYSSQCWPLAEEATESKGGRFAKLKWFWISIAKITFLWRDLNFKRGHDPSAPSPHFATYDADIVWKEKRCYSSYIIVGCCPWSTILIVYLVNYCKLTFRQWSHRLWNHAWLHSFPL